MCIKNHYPVVLSRLATGLEICDDYCQEGRDFS